MNKLNFSKRLKKVIDFYELSAASFAEKIKVQRSSISHLLSGRNKPSLDFVLKVLHEFDEVDFYWLTTGKGVFPKTKKNNSFTPTSPLKDEFVAKTEFVQKELIFENLEKSTDTNILESTSIKAPFIKEAKIDTYIERIVVFYKNGTFKNFTEL